MWTLTADAVAPVDGNWLLSTTAQSTAALVAIVGGFLVSRVISLSSEKSGYERRQRELAAKIEIVSQQEADLHAKTRDTATYWFIEHHLKTYVEQLGNVDAEEALENFFPRGGEAEDMLAVGEGLSESVKRAFGEIQRVYSSAKFPLPGADDLRQDGVVIPFGEDEIYEAVAEHVAHERRQALGRSSSMSSLMRSTARLVSSPDPTVARQDRRITKREEVQAEIAALRAEQSIVSSALDLIGRPQGLTAGLLVLTYFGIVGVVFPLVLMAVRPVPDSGWVRALVVLAFLSGFLWLLGYIVRTVLGLTRPGGSAP